MNCARPQDSLRIFVFESSELATVGGLVSASFGVSVMPVQDPPIWAEGVVYVPIEGAQRKIGLIWSKSRELSRSRPDFPRLRRKNDLVVKVPPDNYGSVTSLEGSNFHAILFKPTVP